jgi:hypothetical protein
MIESKDILALCDRFDAYLLPLDIHILRQRYNGQTFKSTYAVAREMHISDETVRTIENRALDAIAHCLDLEDAGQAITPMRLAKSFRQPVASMLCSGFTGFTTAAAYTAHRGELIIFASSNQAGALPCGYVPDHDPDIWSHVPFGMIIGRCLMVDCFRAPIPNPHPHKSCLNLEQPEAFPAHMATTSFTPVGNSADSRIARPLSPPLLDLFPYVHVGVILGGRGPLVPLEDK